MSPSVVRTVEQPKDLDELQERLESLRGQRCWRVRHSYGDELRLDFGARRRYENPILARKRRGEWVLGARATPWRLSLTHGGPTDSNDDLTAPCATETDLEGARVMAVRALYPDLTLEIDFDNGCRLTVAADSAEPDLAAWELFTPSGSVLSAGPGRSWAETPDDAPA